MRNAAVGNVKSQIIKSGAQSVSYLWSFKFFRAHLLFVLTLKENEQREKNGLIV